MLTATGCTVPDFGASTNILPSDSDISQSTDAKPIDRTKTDPNEITGNTAAISSAVWTPSTFQPKLITPAMARTAITATTVEEFAISPADNVPETVANVLQTEPETISSTESAAPENEASNAFTVEFAISDESGKAATDVIEPTHLFQTIAVTWPTGATAPRLQVRVRSAAGEWGPWFTLIDDGAKPDPGQQSSTGVRAGSDTIFVGDATAFQLATVGVVDKAVPTEKAKVVTIGTSRSTSSIGTSDADTGGTSAAAEIVNAAYIVTPAGQFQSTLATGVNAPRIITRSEWGAANPRCSWPAAPAVRNVIVHHTAGSNNYETPEAAMQQIRNDQAYHQKTRGWCDLGYNFIVDKWGNIYEGAAGSINAAIIGAHTAGFNTGSVGISMLGNYDSVAPNQYMVAAIGQLAAWRLSANGVNPTSQVQLTVHGANTKHLAVGSTITAAAISAHRDLGATTCPGEAGYKQIDAIRAAAANAMGGAPAPVPAKTPTPATSAAPVEPAVIAGNGRAYLTINEMKGLQEGLNRVFPTYSHLTVDGVLGTSSRAVLKEFQRRNNLPETGIPDAGTREALAKFHITW